jgi:alkylation response protein AidB-like acyl-CoA dehydrogenase
MLARVRFLSRPFVTKLLIATARAIAPAIAARAEEIERARRLPADLARTIAEAGLFRMMVPSSLGGHELEPAASMHVIEEIARADASVGWCVMIAATSAMKAAYLPPAVAKEVYGDPLTIAGGVFAPMGRAVPEGDGYRLNGRWQWVSGGANCQWLSGGAAIVEDGKPRLLANGFPDARMMIFPASKARLVDTWHVTGLSGSGSGDMVVEDLHVPSSHTVSIISDKPREPGPLYRFPTFGLLSMGIAAVMLGNARGAIGDLVALAGAKKPQGSRRTLAERVGAQSELAQAEARLRGARAFFHEAIGEAWVKAVAGAELTTEDRASLRLAATHATRTSADVARAMYDLGGGSSLFLSSPLQRRFRDAHAGTAHMMIAPQTYELTGRVLMGLPTDASLL